MDMAPCPCYLLRDRREATLELRDLGAGSGQAGLKLCLDVVALGQLREEWGEGK